MIADIISIKKFNRILTEQLIKDRKLNIYLVFVTKVILKIQQITLL